MLNKIIYLFLTKRWLTVSLLSSIIVLGLVYSPFDSKIPYRNPIPVDVIPDIGENQQIVFTRYQNSASEDVEDQITYPLTTTLLSLPGVKTVRSLSMTGASVIYILFEDGIDFYWARSRILEKINSIPKGFLPENTKPTLGPDATGIGQIYWYTLESFNPQGEPTGGWDLAALRSIQDYRVKYALAALPGVSEVASIGGLSKEYQVNIDPHKMKYYDITLPQIARALKGVDRDMSAGSVEINKVEYLIRGQSNAEDVSTLENVTVSTSTGQRVRIRDLAKVSIGSATRRGFLDKNGIPAVGGVVVIQYGKNAMEVIRRIEQEVENISYSLPHKVLADGTKSQVKIVPFYNRGVLIKKVLGSLESGLTHEIWVTILVICILVFSVRTGLIISIMIPVSVLLTFIAMHYAKVEANIMALSGIAIAMGAIVDIGIVLCENIISHLNTDKKTHKLKTVYRAVREVAPALLTAVSTTVVSFIPVFGLEASEGKLFHPLAYTKTFVMGGSLIIAFTCLPLLTYWMFSVRIRRADIKKTLYAICSLSGLYIFFVFQDYFLGTLVALSGGVAFYSLIFQKHQKLTQVVVLTALVLWILFHLSETWAPIKVEGTVWKNFLFISLLIGGFMGIYIAITKYYGQLLEIVLKNKAIFLCFPVLIIAGGVLIYFGFPNIKTEGNSWLNDLQKKFPGLATEFMPSLDEGAFLLMPTSLPHTGITHNQDMLRALDLATKSVPEVETAVGKAGRVSSAIDPAPVSMFENIINYKPEFIEDQHGRKKKFETYRGTFVRDVYDQLIEAPGGEPYRQWRKHIRSSSDIWSEIQKATKLPSITGAPKLYPIQTRLIMLQTGMRSPLGIIVYGNSLDDIEVFSKQLAETLKTVPSIDPHSLFADRLKGKPYIEILPIPEKMRAYGITHQEVLRQAQTAIGGENVAIISKGRERYPLKIRYDITYRNTPEKIGEVLIGTQDKKQIQLKYLADIKFKPGPAVIKSENAFLCNYLVFSAAKNISDGEAISDAENAIKNAIANGKITPPQGGAFRFGGNYENQIRAERKLMFLVPLTLLIIAVIIFLQFKKWVPTLLVFGNITVAFSGGFILMWCYAQPDFLNIDFWGQNLSEVFNTGKINISVAVWVGFIALFGIATDDAVIMASYIEQNLKRVGNTSSVDALILSAAKKRIRPCMMTTATTVLSLLPILTTSGSGGDVMSAMAIPIFGGMLIEPITTFIIPVLYSLRRSPKKELR